MTSRTFCDIQARGPRCRPAAEQDGFVLIEVLISAMLVALIVVGVLTGFDVTNRATANERSRGVANAIAQQVEDQLRGEPIPVLEKLEYSPRIQTFNQNGTTFTATTEAIETSDLTATASCTSATALASYLRTTTKVTWPALGTRPAVTASSIVSPPTGTALLAQVTDASANSVSGATVEASGPSVASGLTSSLGCSILQLLPGEYTFNAFKTGYVTPNWAKATGEDTSFVHSAYLTAQTTTKEAFRLAPAGTLVVKFESSGKEVEGDTFTTFNSGMIVPKSVGVLNTYAKSISAAGVYPFTSSYSVYAGTCESDNPHAVEPALQPTEVTVPPGGSVTATVKEPPLNLLVRGGYASGKEFEGAAISGATGWIEDLSCPSKRTFITTAEGKLPHPAVPFAKYKLCVTAISGKEQKHWEGEVTDNTLAGPSAPTWTNGGTSGGTGTIYLGINPAGTPKAVEKGGTVSAGPCP